MKPDSLWVGVGAVYAHSQLTKLCIVLMGWHDARRVFRQGLGGYMAMGGFTQGAGYLGEGFRLIRTPGLRRYVVIPLVLNLLIFFLVIGLLYHGFSMLTAYVMGLLPNWAILEPLHWLFWLLYGMVIILLFAYGFVAVANIVGAPFYALLAERVEEQVTGQRPIADEPWWRLWVDVPRSIWRGLAMLGYYLPRAVILLLLGLIPLVNLAVGVLWFLFNSWMMTLQYVDYPADNHRMSVGELKRLLRARRGPTFGFGMPVALGAMIPLFNLVLVPAAVCGGALFWIHEHQRA